MCLAAGSNTAVCMCVRRVCSRERGGLQKTNNLSCICVYMRALKEWWCCLPPRVPSRLHMLDHLSSPRPSVQTKVSRRQHRLHATMFGLGHSAPTHASIPFGNPATCRPLHSHVIQLASTTTTNHSAAAQKHVLSAHHLLHHLHRQRRQCGCAAAHVL